MYAWPAQGQARGPRCPEQSEGKEKVTGDKVRVVITPDPNGPVGQCKAFAFTLHQWS